MKYTPMGIIKICSYEVVYIDSLYIKCCKIELGLLGYVNAQHSECLSIHNS